MMTMNKTWLMSAASGCLALSTAALAQDTDEGYVYLRATLPCDAQSDGPEGRRRTRAQEDNSSSPLSSIILTLLLIQISTSQTTFSLHYIFRIRFPSIWSNIIRMIKT